MARATPIWSSFNSGELSRSLDGQVQNAKYFTGMSICENFLPTIQGPLTRRPGTLFIDPLKNIGFTRGIPFTFSIDQNYVLEFGIGYIRFWRDRAQLLNLGVPYEITTLYTADDLPNIRYVQSADVIYIACGRLPIQKLTRLADTNWTIGVANFKLGPLADQNTTTTRKMYYADAAVDKGAVGNVITITATTPTFNAQMVGQLIELEWETRPDLRIWSVSVAFALGELAYYNGNTYRATTAVGTTGTTPPTHTEGIAQDGGGGHWEYMHSGYGCALITGYTSSTVVTATVMQRLPIDLIGLVGATYRWTEAAYGDDRGWPTCITFFRERLVLTGVRRIDMSVVNDFEAFNRRDAGEVTDDLAIALTIASGRVDGIEWLIPDSNGLVIGTRGQEFLIDEASSNAPFGSTNFRIRPQSQFGSQTNAQVCAVGDTIVYIQRTGRRMLSATYDWSTQKLVSENISVYAEHLLNQRVVDIVYQQNPYSIIWLVMADGSLHAWTYDRLNGVLGGHRHPMQNAFVESACVIPSPDGTTDDVWLFVRRTINGSTVRYAEILTMVDPGTTALLNSYFVDAGLRLISPVDVNTITGLDHLEGETVYVLGDGAVQAPRVVSGGQITAQFPAKRFAVGLPMVSRMQTMRIEAGAQDGTAQIRYKRIHKVGVRWINTLGGKFGPGPDKLDVIPTRAGTSTNMDEPPPAYTADTLLSFPSSWGWDGFVAIVQDQPLPMTIVAIVPQVVTND